MIQRDHDEREDILIASGETREGGYYSLKNNVPQEERGVENFGGSHS
jgi:hypothetical protein